MLRVDELVAVFKPNELVAELVYLQLFLAHELLCYLLLDGDDESVLAELLVADVLNHGGGGDLRIWLF